MNKKRKTVKKGTWQKMRERYARNVKKEDTRKEKAKSKAVKLGWTMTLADGFAVYVLTRDVFHAFIVTVSWLFLWWVFYKTSDYRLTASVSVVTVSLKRLLFQGFTLGNAAILVGGLIMIAAWLAEEKEKRP